MNLILAKLLFIYKHINGTFFDNIVRKNSPKSKSTKKKVQRKAMSRY